MSATVEDVANEMSTSVGAVRVAFHARSWGGQPCEPAAKKKLVPLRIRGLRKDGYGRVASIQGCETIQSHSQNEIMRMVMMTAKMMTMMITKVTIMVRM